MAAPTHAPLPRLKTEEARSQRLVLMRRRATGMLAVVTLMFIAVTITGAHGWLGYVQATAEASMVGALADWFAVVALFRHPLGIPIPHTAIIPERKNQFGETLGDFVQSSFLTPETITERVRAGAVGNRLGAWLAQPANADRIARHIVDAALTAADLVKDEDVHHALEQFVREQLDKLDLAPLAGRALTIATEDGRHRELVDAGIRGLDLYLDAHRDELHDRFGQSSPWWLPGAVEDRIVDRLIDGVRAVLAQMATDPNHHLRREIDDRLAALARELQTSPDLKARADQFKRDLVDQPALRDWVINQWADIKHQLRDQAEDPDSTLRHRLSTATAAIGERLRDDAALSDRVNEAVEAGARYVAEQFSDEIGNIVTTTIERWDAEETARRLELLLGPDLQFIRINGTVVGGLAGLVLHTIAQVAR
jgi:uncharacterized membrane-anchored protein YjiN (DUF445 family)